MLPAITATARKDGPGVLACPRGRRRLSSHRARSRSFPRVLAMAVPRPALIAQVAPRSGLASKHGVTLPNAPGTIDSDYRGEVLVPLINLVRKLRSWSRTGMRIAQMVIAPVVRARGD